MSVVNLECKATFSHESSWDEDVVLVSFSIGEKALKSAVMRDKTIYCEIVIEKEEAIELAKLILLKYT